jgi:hypothetical protein
MRIIKALSLTIAFLVPVAVLAAPRIAGCCDDPDCCRTARPARIARTASDAGRAMTEVP